MGIFQRAYAQQQKGRRLKGVSSCLDLAPPHSVAHSVFVMYIRSLLCCFFPIFLFYSAYKSTLIQGFLGFNPAIASLLEAVRVANCGGESPRGSNCFFDQRPGGSFFYPKRQMGPCSAFPISEYLDKLPRILGYVRYKF